VYKIIAEEISTSTPPHEGIMFNLKDLMIVYNPVYRETWRLLLKILKTVSDTNPKLSAKTISTIFSDIIFRPSEYKSTDMLKWKNLTELLTLMITNHELLFE
jgi:hypothetical protein